MTPRGLRVQVSLCAPMPMSMLVDEADAKESLVSVVEKVTTRAKKRKRPARAKCGMT